MLERRNDHQGLEKLNSILILENDMTTAIEETKREMYAKLARTKLDMGTNYMGWVHFPEFEAALEAHLEELRKDLNFACAALDVEAARRAKLVQERDDIQGRLHAVDHAYFVQSQANAAAGEELRAAKAKIVEQREAICDLYMAKVQRKDLNRAPTLEEIENAAKEATEGLVRQYHMTISSPCTNPQCWLCKS